MKRVLIVEDEEGLLEDLQHNFKYEGYDVMTAKTGVEGLKLALKQKVPIVPVAITGAEESMPLLAKIPAGSLGVPYLPLTPPPLPSKWRIRFSEPMTVEGSTEDLAYVQQQNDRVRDTIAGMLTDVVGS